MRAVRGAAIALGVALVLAACGSDGPAAPETGDGHMTARIDGVAWSSDAAFVDVGVQTGPSGIYLIQGTRVTGSDALSIIITLHNIPGPGTYPLGTGGNVSGGTGNVGETTAGWGTPLSGAAGTITITSMADGRMTGTFSFTAAASTGSAAGTRTVTNGSFDLAIAGSGNATPPAPHTMNRVSATIGGGAWNAATVALQPGIGSTWGFAAGNDSYMLSLTAQDITEPGTYPLSNVVPLRMAGVSDPGGPNCCWGAPLAGTSGSFTIVTWTETRITGTFSFTLQPVSGSEATAPLTVTNGSFDIGVAPPP